MTQTSLAGPFLALSLLPLFGELWRNLSARASKGDAAGAGFLLLMIVIAGLLLGGGFAFFFPQQPLTAFSLGMGAVLSILDPVAAVSFLVAGLVLRPWENGGEPPVLSIPKTLALLSMLSYGLAMLGRRMQAVRWNRAFGLFAALVFWMFFSSLFSQSAEASLLFLSEEFLPVVVIVFLISNAFTRPQHLAVFRAVLLTSVCGLLLNAIFQTAAAPAEDGVQRLHTLGLWGNANDLGAIIAFIFPFAVFSSGLSARPGALRKLFRIGAAALIAYALWRTQSRGAMAAVAVSLVAYYLFCSRSALRWLPAAAAAILLPALFLLNLSRDAEEVGTSTASRRNLAIAGVRMAAAHPVFGVGAAQYPKYYGIYTPSFAEWGERNAHSSWVLILAESGFPGFAVFAGLFLWAFKAAWQVRKRFPEVFLSLIGYVVAMSFLSHSYNLLPYLSVSLVLIARRTMPSEPAEAKIPGMPVFNAGYA